MNRFILSQKTIPNLRDFHNKIKNLVPEFDGFLTNDSEVTVILTVPVTQELIDQIESISPEVVLSQEEKDFQRFTKRAQARDKIIAEMATENMARVRAGIWTTQQLISLTEDAALKNILGDITALSYEIAYSKIDALTNPIVTQDIKDGWKNKLLQHFYLV